MADTLDREDRIRRDLDAGVARELRTPIAVLQAGHEALLDGVAEPTPAELGSRPGSEQPRGCSELNKANANCGTTFTWAAWAFGPRPGWAGRPSPGPRRPSRPICSQLTAPVASIIVAVVAVRRRGL
jgi:hypothetical protein